MAFVFNMVHASNLPLHASRGVILGRLQSLCRLGGLQPLQRRRARRNGRMRFSVLACLAPVIPLAPLAFLAPRASSSHGRYHASGVVHEFRYVLPPPHPVIAGPPSVAAAIEGSGVGVGQQNRGTCDRGRQHRPGATCRRRPRPAPGPRRQRPATALGAPSRVQPVPRQGACSLQRENGMKGRDKNSSQSHSIPLCLKKIF
jgi:hypothetical protein